MFNSALILMWYLKPNNIRDQIGYTYFYVDWGDEITEPLNNNKKKLSGKESDLFKAFDTDNKADCFYHNE